MACILLFWWRQTCNSAEWILEKNTKNAEKRNWESTAVNEWILQRKRGEKEIKKKKWSEIKDSVYGKKGTKRRDDLEREFESFKIGLLLRKAREEKQLTQEELGKIINKKRTYISRVENDGSNITLKTLFDIVEKGLGGKVKISIEL